MAAGIVYHNITTATGVTFSIACWVPNTAAPDVGAIPVALPINSSGTVADLGSGTGGSATPRVIIDSSQFSASGPTTRALSPSFSRPTDEILGFTTVPSTTLTRPASTPTYASGQLFANSATAGSVTNLTWSTAARFSGGSGTVLGAQIQKSGNTVTNAAFRVHLFTVAPTYTSAGDGTAISTVVVGSAKGYLGYIDITTMVGFSDVSVGSGSPDNTRGGIPFVAVAQSLFGLVEIRGAYTGVASEVLTVFLDIFQD